MLTNALHYHIYRNGDVDGLRGLMKSLRHNGYSWEIHICS